MHRQELKGRNILAKEIRVLFTFNYYLKKLHY